MKMREAFKRLLDGEKITRPDWHENAHIRYDENLNTFVLCFWDSSEDVCPDPCFEGGLKPYISFNGEDTEGQMLIENDDKNKIWVSPQEHMELDAMRWKIREYGTKSGICTQFGGDGCIFYKNGRCDESDYICETAFLVDKSNNEIKELYELIKEKE